MYTRTYSHTLTHIYVYMHTCVLQCVAARRSEVQCVAVCCNVLHSVAQCCTVLQLVEVCCSELQRVAACCSAISHMRGWEEREHKKVEETSRECEGVTNPKRDRAKETERVGCERKDRDEDREGDRDQSVACTRSISTCSHKLYKSFFVCQSL